MRLPSLITAVLLAGTAGSFAQTGPFDMSPEKPETATAPVVPEIKDPTAGAAPLDIQLAPAPEAAFAEPAVDDIVPTDRQRRYLLPFADLSLSGERDSRAWSVFLTAEQAASKSTIHLGYQNAVVVAPETSRLRVSINGITVLETPVSSSDKASTLSADIPAALLRAGSNEVRIETNHRHRTDCTVESTYELWTQIKPADTFIRFESPQAAVWKRVEDVRAVGVDETGATHINLIVPSVDQAGSNPQIIRLAQALALTAHMPNQSFTISETIARSEASGVMNVVVGPAGNLPAGVQKPAGADTGPVIALMDVPGSGASTLVLSGPNWQTIDAAISELARSVDRPVAVQRANLATSSWRLPDTPLLTGAKTIRLSELGVATQEFSGRRLRTTFAIGIPSDFYADSYGQATLLLDAAYTSEVRPGSHIDVYVNDNIAATLPITASNGEILRHLPIKVTMRHFRPGENLISIEAVLLSERDTTCAPGSTASEDRRFVLFDSSEFSIPDYARIGRTPNLASISGTGFPYNRAETPVALIIDRAQPQSLTAATTLLARLALSAGRIIPVDVSGSIAAAADRNAIIVGPISQVPGAVLAQVGVTNDSRAGWGETVASVQVNTEATFDQWRDRLRGSGWRGQVSSLQDWLNRTFNLSANTLDIFEGPPELFAPSGGSSLLFAEQASPTGNGTWTVVTAPTAHNLEEGVRSVVTQIPWRQLGGRISTYDPVDLKIAAIATNRFNFMETQPFSFANYRLIIANWLSANALSYSVILTLLSIILGLATATLLRALGRPK